MTAPPSSDPNDRLRRCVRDLAALTALPSLCIGRTPGEALDTLIDALPTALGCDLVYFALPAEGHERASWHGAPPEPSQLAEIRAITMGDNDGADVAAFVGGDRYWCMGAEVPMGSKRGRLLAGRRSALDAETDRVRIRTAANLIGTIVENANVLEAARRKDDFLAILGHELRNPLAPIVTAVELLKRNPAVNRERDVIERHSQHMVRIVDDLLDISRVTRGHVELRNEHVALSSVLERAVEIVSPLVARHRHHLEVDRAEGLTLRGDPIRLAQIFGNLLTNAAKFTPPGGHISVLVGADAGRLRVTVRDTGCGIAGDQLERIFEPFVQADRARDVLRGGLGLGLAIVRNLVERHGGTIAVSSAGRGQGAEFTVELPAVAATAGTVPKAVTQPAGARSSVRILVVDDNPDIAELVSEELQNEGFQVVVANDGSGALQRWRQYQPDAGVFDVGLPDLDGYGVARSIRSEYGADAVLIAVTGYGQPTDRVRSSDAGFDCHFVKPISIAELVKVLDQRVVRGKS